MMMNNGTTLKRPTTFEDLSKEKVDPSGVDTRTLLDRSKADNGDIRAGYVASLRNVSLASLDDASNINTSLHVEAIRQMSSGGNMIYTFTVNSDQQRLVSGQTTVIAVLNIQ